jgi:hypothetical protein
MKTIIKNLLSVLLGLFAFGPTLASAHQPRIVDCDMVEINKPEVSQAFYGELKGSPFEFRIQSNQDFKLYVGLLVPDIPNIRKDISAEIYRVKDGKNETIALLDGSHFEWTPFFEDFAKDNYFWGPEYKADNSIKGEELKGWPVPAGDYRIKVFSPSNFGKYTLVTGFLEVFPFAEILNASITVPRLKAQFFGYPLSVLVASPYVWGYLLAIYALAFIAGFIYRFIVKKFARTSARKVHKNIGKPDRLLRVTIGLGLFLWAVTTSWSPILFFFSGFAFFEAIFSWCGFYAALGKNTYPI